MILSIIIVVVNFFNDGNVLWMSYISYNSVDIIIIII